jgi:hypothetical protein
MMTAAATQSPKRVKLAGTSGAGKNSVTYIRGRQTLRMCTKQRTGQRGR